MHSGEAHALRSQRGALPARAAPGASRRRSPAERRSRIPGAGTRRPLPPARPSPAVIPSPRSHAERPAPMPLRRGILSQTLFVPVPARGPCPSPLTGLWRRAGAAGAQCSRAAASSAAAGSGGRAMPGGEERPGRAGSDMGRGGVPQRLLSPRGRLPSPRASLPPSLSPAAAAAPAFCSPLVGLQPCGPRGCGPSVSRAEPPGNGAAPPLPGPPGLHAPVGGREGGSEAPGAAAERRGAAGGCSPGRSGERRRRTREKGKKRRCGAVRCCPRADDAVSPPAVCMYSEAAPGCKLHTRCKRFLPVPELVSALTGIVFQVGTALRGKLGRGVEKWCCNPTSVHHSLPSACFVVLQKLLLLPQSRVEGMGPIFCCHL